MGWVFGWLFFSFSCCCFKLSDFTCQLSSLDAASARSHEDVQLCSSRLVMLSLEAAL